MSREWQCNVAAGVQISLTVRDSSGLTVYSAPVTIRMFLPDVLKWDMKLID
jgi:hypothetical protein